MKYHFAFDLDGTITNEEILPIIARELGIERKMAKLTRQAMAGEIPFDQGFIKRVEMLKSVPISRVQKIVTNVSCNSHILSFIKENKARCHVVTQNLEVWVEPLLKKIGAPYLTSKANYFMDNLYGVKEILRKKIIHQMIDFPVVVIGEGYNDLEMMMDAPLSIAYGAIHEPVEAVLDTADYAIYDGKQLCNFLKQLL